MATSRHGDIGSFDPASEEWTSYIERLEQYCEMNEFTTATKKRAALLSCCGPSTFALIKSLVAPDKPSEKTFDELVAVATKHFSPKPSCIMQRLKFNTRSHQQGESIADYVAALRKLTEFCEFGDKLNKMIRDRLVCGINNERIQRRLLSEPDLTYEKALKLAKTAESADKDTLKLKQQDCGQDMDPPKPPVVLYNNKRRKPACHRCGANHSPALSF